MTDNPLILYKYASRGRVTQFYETLDNIHTLACHENYVVLCSFDTDDKSYNNPDFLERLKKYPKVIYAFSENKTKIQAINSNMDLVPEFDILVNISDDQRFLIKGFDIEIINAFRKYFPDFDGALHFPEPYSRFDLIVLSIMGKKLYDFFGYIYNPIYLSNYCDEEFTRVCRALNKYAFIQKQIYKHIHPAYDASLPKDELYMRNMNLNWQATDNQTYIQRRDNNFGLY